MQNFSIRYTRFKPKKFFPGQHQYNAYKSKEALKFNMYNFKPDKTVNLPPTVDLQEHLTFVFAEAQQACFGHTASSLF